jgi:Domain of unknown function (DUF4148)
MKFNRTLLSAVILSLVGMSALAQPGKTRGQVTAEYFDAVRTGDIVAVGESSLKLNELHPNRYPTMHAAPAKTREQVKAEYAEAVRTGDVSIGASSLKLNELYPHRYPAMPTAMGKTRDQVRAELAEAIRTGDISVGESSLKLNERFPHLYANTHEQDGGGQAAAQGISRDGVMQ